MKKRPVVVGCSLTRSLYFSAITFATSRPSSSLARIAKEGSEGARVIALRRSTSPLTPTSGALVESEKEQRMALVSSDCRASRILHCSRINESPRPSNARSCEVLEPEVFFVDRVNESSSSAGQMETARGAGEVTKIIPRGVEDRSSSAETRFFFLFTERALR